MSRRLSAFRSLPFVLISIGMSACTTMELRGVDFMGQNSFEEDLEDLENSFPGADETPDLPTGVRTDEEWDQSAREMGVLFDVADTPELKPSLSDEEFDQQFDSAQDAASEYKKDDPQ